MFMRTMCLIVWPTAGDITADSPLLRAHPLTHGGITDSPLLGRTLAHGSIEVRRWLTRPAVPLVGVAAFIDAARAWQTASGASDLQRSTPSSTGAPSPFALDGGIGVRVRLPGATGWLGGAGRGQVLRIDFARNLYAHQIDVRNPPLSGARGYTWSIGWTR